MYIYNKRVVNKPLKPIAAPWAAPAQLFVAAALRATATADNYGAY
jgi:hypothetical protein